jgi:membrane protein DedA with SNARE-associated domain
MSDAESEGVSAFPAGEPDPPAVRVGAGQPPPDAASARDGRRRRWRVARADALCLGSYVLANVYGLALIPVMPSLLATHPVLLEALQGSVPSVVAAGAFTRVGRTPLWAALTAPLFGMTCLDPITWWLGRRFGRRVLDHVARRGESDRRRIARGEDLFRRWGPWILVAENYQPVPNNVLYLIAGAGGMPLARFIALDLVGAALWIVPMVALGYALGQHAVAVAQTISRDSLWWAGLAVAALVAYNLQPWLRRRRSRPPA